MKKYQAGFSVVALLIALYAVAVLALLGGVAYVAAHFIAKFW